MLEILAATGLVDLDEFCRLEHIDRNYLDELVRELVERKIAQLTLVKLDKPVIRPDVLLYMQL
jgi:hypothetical protein